MKQIILFGLLFSALAVNAGCCTFSPCYGRSCGPAACNDGGDSCGPAYRTPRLAPCNPPYAARRVASCNSCGDCDPCNDSCGCGSCRPWYRGPLSCPFAWLLSGIYGCSGCGERYWGDFYGDPPDCYDPCDNCGNYVGNASSGGCGCGNRGGSVTRSYARRGHVQGYDGDYADEGAELLPPTEGTVITKPERTVKPAPAPTSTLKPAVESPRSSRSSARVRPDDYENNY